MNTKLFQRGAIFVAFFFVMSGSWAVDLSITIPDITLGGAFAGLVDPADAGLLNQMLEQAALAFETQIENDPDIEKFSDQSDLALGFANTGSATALTGLFRTPRSYKLFSAAYGFGLGVSLPGLDTLQDINSGDFITDKGDIYFGAAFQPINFSLGINLGFLVSGLRANVKGGYSDLSGAGDLKELKFNSLSLGAGVSYDLLKAKSLAVGLLKWQGVVVSSGFYYQRNRVEMSYTPDEEGFLADQDSITLGEIGLKDVDLIPLGYSESSLLGKLATTPKIQAKIESSTFTIPIEVSTAIRLLYVVDLMVGAGVDLAFGSSEVGLRADSDVEFVVDPALVSGLVDSTPGNADLVNKTTSKPQLFRPRVMAGLGFGAGPMQLEIPFIIYFDSKGNTYVTGVTVGFML